MRSYKKKMGVTRMEHIRTVYSRQFMYLYKHAETYYNNKEWTTNAYSVRPKEMASAVLWVSRGFLIKESHREQKDEWEKGII